MKEPVLVEMDEFLVMGVEITTSLAAEANGQTALLPRLWATFFSEKIEGKISQRKDASEYTGVYSDYDMDPKSRTYGQYGAMAGCEVNEIEEVPEGLMAMPVPAGKYLLFEARGPMPEALIRTWSGVWDYFEKNKDYRRAFTVDFDLYHKDRPDAVDVFVAIQPSE